MPGQHQNGCTNNRVALRDFQLFQMGILHEFKRICEENGLTWWLAYGSLLGAIRHKGFIPWDDDIDVLMPAEDYMRFRELCRTELSDGFYLQVHEDNPCNFIPWQRIGVTSSTSLPHEYVDIHAEWGAVSYTHLDVYKRQALSFPAWWLPGQAPQMAQRTSSVRSSARTRCP